MSVIHLHIYVAVSFTAVIWGCHATLLGEGVMTPNDGYEGDYICSGLNLFLL